MRSVLNAVACTALAGALLAGTGALASTSGGGSQRWTAGYDLGANAWSDAVALSPDGSTVYVTGTTDQGSSDSRFATLAYDASTGAKNWVANYTATSNPGQYGRGNALAVSPDGSTLFVTGSSSCSGCGVPAFDGYSTIAYDTSTGDRLWAARYAVDGGPYSIAVSPNGARLFVNGQAEGGDASATVAYDASNGNQLWALPSDDGPAYWGGGLSVSPDNTTVFVVGTSHSATGCYSESGGYHTAAYHASNGSLRWMSSYQIANDHVCGTATSLDVSANGSTVLVTGYGGSGGGSVTNRSGTVAYDAVTGNQLWARQDTNISVLGGDTVVHLAASPDGSKVFVLGSDCADSPCPVQPFATVAYDVATGHRLWVSRYDGGGLGYPNALAVSSDGSTVFETGQETVPCIAPCASSGVDAPLVAYDAETGSERWATTFADNNAWALAVSPDGSSVYLAGTFTTSAAASAARRERLASASSSKTCSSGTCGYSIARYNTERGPGTFEDLDSSLRYDGWRSFFAKGAIGGAYRASHRVGDTAIFKTPQTSSVVWLTHRGPNQGKAKVTIDGRRKRVVDLYRPEASASSVTFKGLARRSHTVEVQVLGRKDPASTGTWVAVDGFELKAGSGMAAESSTRIRYGAWDGALKRAASGGSYRASASPQAKISLTFTGRSVTWITAKGPAYGRAKVVIDGKPHIVDLYRRTGTWQVPIAYTGLARGTHHIKVRPLGVKDASSRSKSVVFDAFVVRSD
jgi:sugar lactone lactonase YvrE